MSEGLVRGWGVSWGRAEAGGWRTLRASLRMSGGDLLEAGSSRGPRTSHAVVVAGMVAARPLARLPGPQGPSEGFLPAAWCLGSGWAPGLTSNLGTP
jgi:hypothetical protein